MAEVQEETTTLRSAVEAAANEQNQKEKQEEVKKEQEETPKEQENKEEEKFVPDPQIEEAVNFYNAIRDPSQQKEIIAELARRAGLIKPNEQPTRAEEKQYKELLAEVLGEEYPDLKDKFSKILEAFEKQNDEKLNAVKQELYNERMQRAVTEFEEEFSNFIKENKVTESDAAKMLKEIEDLPPSVGKNGKRIALTTYLGKIHQLVAGKKAEVDKEVKRAEKIQNNLKERSTHLSSDVSEDRLRKGSKLPSIKEAIKAASEGITFDE